MTKLNRDLTPSALDRARFLAAGQEDVAKQQAYILRDLIKQHCGVSLTGGDVTDCLALVFHEMDWARLMSNLRGGAEKPYYAVAERDVLAQRARRLTQLIGPVPTPIRPLLDMPRAKYETARTVAGAQLATLMCGRPSWRFSDVSVQVEKGRRVPIADIPGPMIFDARTDRAYLPMHFCSDPMTNAEQVRGVDPVTGEQVEIPIDDVRYTRFARPAGATRDDYALTEHARTESQALAAYKQALNFSLARRWFEAGNDLHVTVFHAGDKIKRVQLSDWGTDFDGAILNVREQHSMGNVVITASGLNEVRDPAERWQPAWKHVRAIMPEVETADAAFQSVLDSLGEYPGVEAEQRFEIATRTFNEVLLRALDAYWRDTREINSREALMQSYATTKPATELCFGVGALQKLREMIGLDPRGNPKVEKGSGVDLRDPALTEARIGGWKK